MIYHNFSKMQRDYSLRSPAVKRLMREAQELREPTENFYAQPLDDNLFEWHFTVRGQSDTEFDGGIYHGRITFPPEYPMKPPSIMLFTPNGRFEIGKKICLSISGYHPETWQPSWSIRTVLLAIIGFMPTHGHGAIGSLDYTPDERKLLAKRSQEWKCKDCDITMKGVLKEPNPHSTTTQQENQEAQQLAAQINFKEETKKNGSTSTDSTQPAIQNQPIPPNALAAAFQQQLQMPLPSMFYMSPQFQAMLPPGMQPSNLQQQQQQQQLQQQQRPEQENHRQITNSTETDNQQNSDVSVPNSPEGDATGIRRRRRHHIHQERRETQTVSGRQDRSRAEVHIPNRRQQGDNTAVGAMENPRATSGSLVLIVILSIVIAILMLRRLYITYEYKFDYDL